jgi:hypothetical protein
LIKGHGVLAGKRVVVAGSGPFLLPVAAGVVKAGGQVVELLEANKSRRWISSAFVILENLSKIKEGFYYIKTISEAKVRARFGYAVVAAHAGGNGELESVDVAKINRNFKVKKVRNVRCDVAAIGWGFTPDTTLAGTLGCKQIVAKDGSVVVSADTNQQSSVTGVFVAGEITGIGGSELSMAEGVIAGLSAAKFVGCQVEVSKAHKQRRAKKQRFANALIKSYPVKDGWKSWVHSNTVVCRCEEVKLSDLNYAIDELDTVNMRENRQEMKSEESMFLQAYEQAKEVDPAFFRSKKMPGDPLISFKVNFKGENVEGIGGPYRQFFSDISSELQDKDYKKVIERS